MDALFAATTSRQFVSTISAGPAERQAYTQKVVAGLCDMLKATNGSPTIVSWLLSAFERLTWKELSTNSQGLTPSQIVARIGQLSLQSCCYHGGIKALEALELSAQYEQSKRREGSSGVEVTPGRCRALLARLQPQALQTAPLRRLPVRILLTKLLVRKCACSLGASTEPSETKTQQLPFGARVPKHT